MRLWQAVSSAAGAYGATQLAESKPDGGKGKAKKKKAKAKGLSEATLK